MKAASRATFVMWPVFQLKKEVPGRPNPISPSCPSHFRLFPALLHQTKTKMIIGSFYTILIIVEYILPVKTRYFRAICLSVCLSVTHLSLIHNWNLIESSFCYGEVPPYTSTWWSNLESKVKVTGKENIKENDGMSSWKTGRFMSKQGQNDSHSSAACMHPRERVV